MNDKEPDDGDDDDDDDDKEDDDDGNDFDDCLTNAEDNDFDSKSAYLYDYNDKTRILW